MSDEKIATIVPRAKRSIWKRACIVIVVIVLALMVISTIIYSRYLHPSEEITPRIYAIRNDRNGFPFVNFFLFQIGENYIAFDAGYDNHQTESALQNLGISACVFSTISVLYSGVKRNATKKASQLDGLNFLLDFIGDLRDRYDRQNKVAQATGQEKKPQNGQNNV